MRHESFDHEKIPKKLPKFLGISACQPIETHKNFIHFWLKSSKIFKCTCLKKLIWKMKHSYTETAKMNASRVLLFSLVSFLLNFGFYHGPSVVHCFGHLWQRMKLSWITDHTFSEFNVVLARERHSVSLKLAMTTWGTLFILSIITLVNETDSLRGASAMPKTILLSRIWHLMFRNTSQLTELKLSDVIKFYFKKIYVMLTYIVNYARKVYSEKGKGCPKWRKRKTKNEKMKRKRWKKVKVKCYQKVLQFIMKAVNKTF